MIPRGDPVALVESQGQFEAFPNGHKKFWVDTARLKIKQDTLGTMLASGFLDDESMGLEQARPEERDEATAGSKRRQARAPGYERQWERFLDNNGDALDLPPCPPRIGADPPILDDGEQIENDEEDQGKRGRFWSLKRSNPNVLLHLPLVGSSIWRAPAAPGEGLSSAPKPRATVDSASVSDWVRLVTTERAPATEGGDKERWSIKSCVAPDGPLTGSVTLRLRAFADTEVDVVRGQMLLLKVVPRPSSKTPLGKRRAGDSLTSEYGRRTTALRTIRLLVEEVYYGTQQYANFLTGGRFVDDVDKIESVATKNAHVVCRLL